MGLNDDSFYDFLDSEENKNFPVIEGDLSDDFNWSSCQTMALSDIAAWSYRPDELFWGLTGSAGTGKTTVMKEVLNVIKQKYGVCVSAPTHKAKEVISRATGLNSETVQRLLGLKPDLEVENFNINKIVFDYKSKPLIQKFSLVIIDEASMLNSDLLTYLKDQARRYKVKILFVGDALQLPPVGEDVSPALLKENLNGMSELLTPVRQATDNPLSLLLLALRYDIQPTQLNYDILKDALYQFKDAEFRDIDIDLELYKAASKECTFLWLRTLAPEFIIDGKGYVCTDSALDLQKHAAMSFLDTEFIEDKQHSKIIAYNNVTVNDYAFVIRNELFKTRECIVVGDLMTSYKHILTYPDLNPILINSEDYEVIAVTKTMSEEDINGYSVTLKALVSGREVDVMIVDIKDTANFVYKHRPFHNEGKHNKKWPAYYKFKNNHLLLEDLNKKYKDDTLPSKDLSYIFGSTVHKSQGSTYNKVFVDGKNIGGAFGVSKHAILIKMHREANAKEIDTLRKYCLRLMYVAISRARNFAMIHI